MSLFYLTSSMKKADEKKHYLSGYTRQMLTFCSDLSIWQSKLQYHSLTNVLILVWVTSSNFGCSFLKQEKN